MQKYLYLLPCVVLICALIPLFVRYRRQQKMRTRTLSLTPRDDLDSAPPSANLATGIKQRLGAQDLRLLIATAGLSWLFGSWLAMPLWLALPLALIGTWLTFFLRRRYRLQRARAQFSSDFPAAIDHLTRAIQAGIPMERALTSIGDSFPDELGKRFRRLAQELEIGVSFRDAMQHLSRDLNMPDVSFFCSALSLNRDSGGALAHILSMLSKTLHDRRHAALKLRTLTAESRAAARIVGALPLIIVALQAWLNPRQFHFLLHDPSGHAVLAIAAASIVSGMLIIWRMARL